MTILIPEWFLYVLAAWIAVEFAERAVNIYRTLREWLDKRRFEMEGNDE